MAEDYTIAEIYTLPSKGKIYGEGIDPAIKLRSMTTLEEMRRQSISRDYPFRTYCDIIDACIVGEKPMSSYDMCIGDYQFLLHKLRVVTYGTEYTIDCRCPYCNCENEDTIDLDDLVDIECPDNFEELLSLELPVSKQVVKMRFQTPRIADRINVRIKEYKKKRKGAPDPSLMITLSELIETIDGETKNYVELENWLMKLPMADTNAMFNRATEIVDAIGVDTELFLTCDVCGLSFYSQLPTDSEFFRPGLNSRR